MWTGLDGGTETVEHEVFTVPKRADGTTQSRLEGWMNSESSGTTRYTLKRIRKGYISQKR